MTRRDFEEGHASIADFFYWINERHNIYRARERGEEWPWTQDPILQEFKFTNVFRELDAGTLALREMIEEYRRWCSAECLPVDESLILWNIFWYRLFNRADHAAFHHSPRQLMAVLRKKADQGEKIFTSAHMTWGPDDPRGKMEAYFDVIEEFYDRRQNELSHVDDTLQGVFDNLIRWRGVGPFIAYEMACDLRFELKRCWQDTLSWANIGPGCARGLKRLGLPRTLDSLTWLYYVAENYLPLQRVLRPKDLDWSYHADHQLSLQNHLVRHHVGWARFNELKPRWPLFELREIEHSLCEFDKYQRVKTGAGRPRQRFIPPHLRED